MRGLEKKDSLLFREKRFNRRGWKWRYFERGPSRATKGRMPPL